MHCNLHSKYRKNINLISLFHPWFYQNIVDHYQGSLLCFLQTICLLSRFLMLCVFLLINLLYLIIIMYQSWFWHSMTSFVYLMRICFWNEILKLFAGLYCLKMKMGRCMFKRFQLFLWFRMALQLCFMFGAYSEHISFRFSFFLNLASNNDFK
jgi:hypothetical protein